MIERCCNPNHISWENYGGRGIRVCDDWLISDNFIAWAQSHGYSPGLHLDRIDFNGGYGPDNCRWLTPMENASTKRNNHWIEVFGERMTVSQAARKFGLRPSAISQRIKKLLWDAERACTTPVVKRYPRAT
jgi:hypothetical protein